MAVIDSAFYRWRVCGLLVLTGTLSAQDYGEKGRYWIDPGSFTVDLNLGGPLPSYDHMTDKERELRVAATSQLLNSLNWNKDLLRIDPSLVDKRGRVSLNLSQHFSGANLADFLDGEPYPYACNGTGLPTKEQGFRMDWLISQGMRFQVYKNVLDLPKNLSTLTKSLGISNVPLDRNTLNLSLGRNSQGLAESGVALGISRLLELQRIQPYQGGSFTREWRRTWDTISDPKPGRDTDFRNFVLHPKQFKFDGGEIIFHLPNFYRGWLLADAKGNLIGEAPSNIVLNAFHPEFGEALKAPLSCMTCHSGTVQPSQADRETRDRLAELAKGLRARLGAGAREYSSYGYGSGGGYDEARASLQEIEEVLRSGVIDTIENHSLQAGVDDQKTLSALHRSGGFVPSSEGSKEPAMVLPQFALAYDRPVSLTTAAKELSSALGWEVTKEELTKTLSDPKNAFAAQKAGYEAGRPMSRRQFESGFCELKEALVSRRALRAGTGQGANPEGGQTHGTQTK
jgi:hypothetical protein